MPAIERHGLRLGLPALLQRFDRVDAQHRLPPEFRGFDDHGLAAVDTFLLSQLERGARGVERRVPQRLQFRKYLLADVARIVPTVGKLMQRAVVRLQVRCVGMRLCPSLYLVDQRDALGTVFRGIRAHFVEPRFDHLVRFVARFVESLPQPVIRHATLVALLPLVAQRAQDFLHLSATEGLAFGALQQTFGLGDQVFANLVRAPALPAFELTGGNQGRMHA